MNFADLLYFLRQIFFPNWTPREETDDDPEPSALTLWIEAAWKKLRSHLSVGTAVSLLVHAVVLLALSLIFLPGRTKWDGIELIGGTVPPDVVTKDISLDVGKNSQDEDKPQDADAAPEPEQVEIAPVTRPDPPSMIEAPVEPALTTAVLQPGAETPAGAAESKWTAELVAGGGYEGRTREGRGRSVGVGDSSTRGENAVEAALQWIAAHQNKKDGGWSFDFDESCKRCSQSGTHGSRVAATALALLPFLGAGYTHQEGPYREVVDHGLHFLVVRAVKTARGAELNQGTEGMYSHGIATLALCEAYALSRQKQPTLRDTAQDALRFIENAQNELDGGWRYTPNPPMGDLSVTAWQVMALKSGRLAGLHVSQGTIYLAGDFLEIVADDGGRRYRYLPDRDRQGIGPDSWKTCNATGLLLRMYLGRQPGEKMLDEGIDMLADLHPLKGDDTQCNLYLTYYAMLALHHYDGSHWRRWNNVVREFLVDTQARRGHEAGSWFFQDEYCDKGGRLLNTALATLILETPYRIMPLFRRPGE